MLLALCLQGMDCGQAQVGADAGTGACARACRTHTSHDLYKKGMDSMDTRTLQEQQGAAVGEVGADEEVQRRIAVGQQTIKARMPGVYASIRAKALVDVKVWGRVRSGLAGVPNCFWAYEAGQVVGTPFAGYSGMGQLADVVAQFGCAHVCIVAETANGTH